MKNFGNYKKIVEVLKEKDKEMRQMQEGSVKKPKSSSVDDVENFVEQFCDSLGQHIEDSSDMLSYMSTKLSLLEEEQKILKEIEKQKRPEDILFTLDSKFFKDYGFIADVVEICAQKIGSRAEEWAEKTYNELKTENKHFTKSFKLAWIKDQLKTQSANFNYRLLQLFVEAQKDLDKENELFDNQLEEELKKLKERLIINDVIPPEKD